MGRGFGGPASWSMAGQPHASRERSADVLYGTKCGESFTLMGLCRPDLGTPRKLCTKGDSSDTAVSGTLRKVLPVMGSGMLVLVLVVVHSPPTVARGAQQIGGFTENGTQRWDTFRTEVEDLVGSGVGDRVWVNRGERRELRQSPPLRRGRTPHKLRPPPGEQHHPPFRRAGPSSSGMAGQDSNLSC